MLNCSFSALSHHLPTPVVVGLTNHLHPPSPVLSRPPPPGIQNPRGGPILPSDSSSPDAPEPWQSSAQLCGDTEAAGTALLPRPCPAAPHGLPVLSRGLGAAPTSHSLVEHCGAARALDKPKAHEVGGSGSEDGLGPQVCCSGFALCQ